MAETSGAFVTKNSSSSIQNLDNQIDIIQGCKQNNRQSQEKLYMQFYPVLSALCRRFFDDKQEVISALNNGMLKVFKNISHYDEAKSELLTWMYTIVRNEALTMLRNKKFVVGVHELPGDVADETSVNPLSHSAGEEVIYYLSKLPPATRTVCSLFYAEGYAIKEIATALNIKEGTIKWHLSEGRKKLQSLVKVSHSTIKNSVR